eukprot:414484-Pelagomonas_calceolata.AAC.1
MPTCLLAIIKSMYPNDEHFNSRGDNVPVFTLGGARLECADSFRYLGMLFTHRHVRPQAPTFIS